MQRFQVKHSCILVFLFVLITQFVYAEGDGYGENPGGAGGDTIVVDNKEDFKTYAGLPAPYVILIKDTIDVGSEVRVVSFKTISGLDSTSTVIGNISIKSGTNNVVVKNLNITNPMNDGITIRNAQYIYVTNCTVFDCQDGCIDITVESDFVTVSHCKFYYDQITYHKFVNLIGASDDDVSDRGKLHVTMHNNWWDTGCTSRMPRVRFGYVHVYNNYFSCDSNNYCTRAGLEGHIYSERNYFDGVRDPVTVDQGGMIKTEGNEYVNCTGTTYAGTDDVFTPSYNYTAFPAIDIKELVKSSAGNGNHDSIVNSEKKETIISWSDQEDIIFGTALSQIQLNATATGNTSTPVYSHPVGTQLPEGYNTITVTFPEDENYKAASKTVNIKVNYVYHKLLVNTVDAGSTDLINISPDGKMENGILLYPLGTVVTLTASPDFVSEFDHWQNGETNDTLLVTMNEDTEVTAYYAQKNYVAAWDLYEQGNRERSADYYISEENKASVLYLRNETGTSINWSAYSMDNLLLGKNAAMIRRGSSSVGDYYYQLNFNATNFENIKIEASMLGMLSYYKIQNVEYSIDGIVFNKVGEYNLAQDSTWYHETFQLPENVNGANSVMVRFKADKSSELIVNGVIGTSISEILVLGDYRTNTSVAANKTNLKIMAKQYYSIDGRQLRAPVQGINLVVTRYSDGSTSAKKIYYINNGK